MSSDPRPVRYGAMLKLRHRATGGTLRSHPFVFGNLGASGQATVTCFAGPDKDDLWRVKGPHGQPPDVAKQVVVDGEVVRFEHVASRKNLHSQTGFSAPVSAQQEVCCFGEFGIGDAGDDWRVEVEGGGPWDGSRRVRLVHLATGQPLHAHQGFEHAQWTLGQQEVTCFSEGNDNDWWLASDFLARDAYFISQSVPGAIEVGRSQAMVVTMRNVGTDPWSAEAGYRLGAQNPEDTQIWGRNRVEVAGAVAPGQDAALSFTVTAPTARGPARMQWRMLQEGAGWFGDSTPVVTINVVLPGGQATVPDVRGAFKVAAVAAIRAAGLEPRVTGAMGSRGAVFTQSPPPYTLVDRGSTVVLHLTTD
jgi:hypothetical protein